MGVLLDIDGCEIEAKRGQSVFDCAELLDVRVPTSCHKQGKCRECLVEVIEGMDLLSAPSPEELHLTGDFRLSCRARIEADEGRLVCHTLRRGAMRIEEGGSRLGLEDRESILDPAVTRDGDRILLDGKELAWSMDPIHGLALDLGTTTCVLRLVDLETGERIASTSFENPQRFGGTDVMARIKYDTDHKGKLLQRTLLGYLTHAIESFPVDPSTIYEMTVAGNSTMRDLFFGMNVESIGQKPYRSITQYEVDEGKRASTSHSSTAKKLRLPLHPKARIFGLPLICGHVGADAAACLLAIDLAHETRTVMLMDIGTNTELILGNKDRILAASCPAGPAFEGGAIACGMPGLEGAIENVFLREDGTFETTTIGGIPPEGICGSGMVDLLSELLRTDRMNVLGRLEDDRHRMVLDEARNIYFAESDINEIAQAKGANVAGIRIVLKNYGITVDDLEVFYLAGGFGRRINVEAARRIGLVPDLDGGRIVQVGNASIEGAEIALLSRSKRVELENLVKRIEHVELETDPDFFDHFVIGCQFVPVNSDSLLGLA